MDSATLLLVLSEDEPIKTVQTAPIEREHGIVISSIFLLIVLALATIVWKFRED